MKNEKRSALSGKIALVTGGAGFIGSHLCEGLVKEGYNVISLDNYFVGTRENHVLGVDYRKGHTKDIATHVTEKVDIIFHLGEYSRVEQSLLEPDLVWDLNMQGTFGVLEYWREIKCKMVYAGSSTKFADGGVGRDQSPYAFMKATNTELVSNYADWYGLPFAVTYFYNVYGPRERSGKYGTLIEIFRQLFLEGKSLTVRLPGTQLRIFTHVDDIVDGLLLVGEKGMGDEFGLGAEQTYSVMEIAKMFDGEITTLPERGGNRMKAKLDTSKSHAIGWKAKYDVADYIREIVSKENK